MDVNLHKTVETLLTDLLVRAGRGTDGVIPGVIPTRRVYKHRTEDFFIVELEDGQKLKVAVEVVA